MEPSRDNRCFGQSNARFVANRPRWRVPVQRFPRVGRGITVPTLWLKSQIELSSLWHAQPYLIRPVLPRNCLNSVYNPAWGICSKAVTSNRVNSFGGSHLAWTSAKMSAKNNVEERVARSVLFSPWVKNTISGHAGIMDDILPQP